MSAFQAHIRFSSLSEVENEPMLQPVLKIGRANRLVTKAYGDALLDNGDDYWFRIASVQKSLIFQAMMLGNVRREFGKVSFLTHLIEVTHRVYNCPELIGFYDDEVRAFVPANHDLEDICKKFGLAADIVLTPVLDFVSHRDENSADRSHSVMQGIQTDLFMLLDPLAIHGRDRADLQIERAREMSLLAVYTRGFDKICTYARDLYNMRTIDPVTGRPYLSFDNRAEADNYLKKIVDKGILVKSLAMAETYKEEWRGLCSSIGHEVERQLEAIPSAPSHSVRKTVRRLLPHAGSGQSSPIVPNLVLA